MTDASGGAGAEPGERPSPAFGSSSRLSIFSCLSLGAGGLLFLLFTLPLLTLALRAISERGWETTSYGAVAQAVTLSFITTGITALLTLLLGTPLAYTLATRRFPLARAAEVFIELPIVLPPAVAGLALLLMFGRRGWFGGLLDDAGLSLAFTTTAVVLAQLFVSTPFFIRSAQNGFASRPSGRLREQGSGTTRARSVPQKFWRCSTTGPCDSTQRSRTGRTVTGSCSARDTLPLASGRSWPISATSRVPGSTSSARSTSH